jgi:hypothetical protein
LAFFLNFENFLNFDPSAIIERQFCFIFSDGFRKVVGAEQGGLKAEKDDWQFQNANFIRSQPRLLENVKRKVYFRRNVFKYM